MTAERAPRKFVVLTYRMPAKPTAGRVAVWRNLKKIGAVYLQDSICVLPDTAALRRELAPVLERIDGSSGRYHLLPLRTLPPDEQTKLVALFVEQAEQHYREIIENCEVNFVKEIEFERFRQNFTYEEAEEIRMEFEKIDTWFERVQERDFFGAPNRAGAQAWLDRCERLLEEFEATVFELNATDTEAPADAFSAEDEADRKPE
jgi:Protein ChrB, N-terminal